MLRLLACLIAGSVLGSFVPARAEPPVLNAKAAVAAARVACRDKVGPSRTWIADLDQDKKFWTVITMPGKRRGEKEAWVTSIAVFGSPPTQCEDAYLYAFRAPVGSKKIEALQNQLLIEQAHAEGAECILPAGSITSLRIEDFPARLRKAMPGLGGVDEGYRSDGTPGHTDLPSAHLIRIYRRDSRWVVLYGVEAGLGELKRSLLVMDTNPNGSLKRRISDREVKSHRDLCNLVSDNLSMR